MLTFPVPPGSYHVVVYHRNHLPLMSVAKTLSYDVISSVTLTTAAGVFGGATAAADLPGTSLVGLVAGDATADGSVLADDREAGWLPQAGAEGYLPGDFDLDGAVLADDRQALWLPNLGRQTQVPSAPLAPTTTQ